jgi:hypothetical protein
VPTATPEPLVIMRVNVAVLNIRACPSTSCDVLDTVTAGTTFAVKAGFQEAGGFRWREIDGRAEWVAELHLESGTIYLMRIET